MNGDAVRIPHFSRIRDCDFQANTIMLNAYFVLQKKLTALFPRVKNNVMSKSTPEIYIKQYSAIISVILLIIIGHLLAVRMQSVNNGWFFVVGFYALWIAISIFSLLSKDDLKRMYAGSKKVQWNLLSLFFLVPAFVIIFVPNLDLLKPNMWNALNIILCIVNPFVEETYWRGLIDKYYDKRPLLSFIVSTFGFALSHPLIWGNYNETVNGWVGFVGAFVVGTVWWICFRKTKSLRGPVFTHFL